MSFDLETIASYSLHNPEHFDVQLGQTTHRKNLIDAWKIRQGEHVLELGCGQGDCTAVLAATVGESGRVTATDPASPDYGSPYTLGQAQAHLRASPIGKQITFVRSESIDFLTNATITYDTAVLAHCIWYFTSPSALKDTLDLLSTRARRVCIAEYALYASKPSAQPHVFAALAQASLECRKPLSESNIRTVLGPRQIKAIAAEVGLRLVEDGTLVAPGNMYDGRWEITKVLGSGFDEEVEKYVHDEREKAVIQALKDATAESKLGLVDENVSTMDIWFGVFERNVI